MPSRQASASEYPLTTLSHRSSLNLNPSSSSSASYLAMPRLEGYDNDDLQPGPSMSRSGSRSGKRGKKRLSDGGDEEEESAALLGRDSRGFEDFSVGRLHGVKGGGLMIGPEWFE